MPLGGIAQVVRRRSGDLSNGLPDVICMNRGHSFARAYELVYGADVGLSSRSSFMQRIPAADDDVRIRKTSD